MKIESSSLQLQASHLRFEQTVTEERLEMWVGERGRRGVGAGLAPGQVREFVPAAAGREQVQLSDQGKAAQRSDAVGDAMDAAENDPRLKLLRTMIEFLTGKPIKLVRMDPLNAPDQAANVPQQAAANPPANATGSAGFGIDYQFTSTRSEFEAVEFQAQGRIRTADGVEIEFEVAFAMARSYSETIDVRFTAGDAGALKDPLVLDFGGPAAALSDTRFEFDLDADGQLDAVPMLAGGRGFLAIDRNDNGRIDDGRELFGPTTGRGFAELAVLDQDGNGWIDESDPTYALLRIWNPDANGAGQLQTLAEAGVGALNVASVATPFELRNNANQSLGVMRESGIYLRSNYEVGTLSQIDLRV